MGRFRSRLALLSQFDTFRLENALLACFFAPGEGYISLSPLAVFLDLRRFVEMLCLHVREAGTGGRNDESGECAVALSVSELDMLESMHGSIQYQS